MTASAVAPEIATLAAGRSSSSSLEAKISSSSPPASEDGWPVRCFQPVGEDSQIVGHIGHIADITDIGDIAEVVGEDSQDGERGLEVGIVGVEIAEVARIRVGI